MKLTKTISTIAFLLLIGKIGYGQCPNLDPNYNSGQIQAVSLPQTAYPNQYFIDDEGAVLVWGTDNMNWSSVNKNGQLQTTFNANVAGTLQQYWDNRTVLTLEANLGPAEKTLVNVWLDGGTRNERSLIQLDENGLLDQNFANNGHLDLLDPLANPGGLLTNAQFLPWGADAYLGLAWTADPLAFQGYRLNLVRMTETGAFDSAFGINGVMDNVLPASGILLAYKVLANGNIKVWIGSPENSIMGLEISAQGQVQPSQAFAWSSAYPELGSFLNANILPDDGLELYYFDQWRSEGAILHLASNGQAQSGFGTNGWRFLPSQQSFTNPTFLTAFDGTIYFQSNFGDLNANTGQIDRYANIQRTDGNGNYDLAFGSNGICKLMDWTDPIPMVRQLESNRILVLERGQQGIQMAKIVLSDQPMQVAEETQSSPEFAISPNPWTDQSVLSYTNFKDMQHNLSIYDQLGRLLYQRQLDSQGEGHYKISLSMMQDWPEGVYNVVWTGKGELAKTVKILK